MLKKCHTAGNTTLLLLAGAALFSSLTYLGLTANPFAGTTQVSMRTEPQQGMYNVSATFPINIMVESNIPVNVFAGDIYFNPEVLAVEKIDYNTSIADLWAERPWYSNGDGVINFAGGTTQPGGFEGSGSLLTVTFKTLQSGRGDIVIKNARILIHDGLGTDATVEAPIDTVITINEPETTQEILRATGAKTNYVVAAELPSTDLNADGKQSIADLSIFMMHLARGDVRSDFNQDGKVNTADLSILLEAR